MPATTPGTDHDAAARRDAHDRDRRNVHQQIDSAIALIAGGDEVAARAVVRIDALNASAAWVERERRALDAGGTGAAASPAASAPADNRVQWRSR